MVKQTAMTVAASPDTKVFVYRNMIKALPWFTVRALPGRLISLSVLRSESIFRSSFVMGAPGA